MTPRRHHSGGAVTAEPAAPSEPRVWCRCARKNSITSPRPAASWQSELRHDEIRDQPPPPRYPGGSPVDCCRRREDATLLFSSTTSSCRLSAGLATPLPTTHHPPQKEIKKKRKKYRARHKFIHRWSSYFRCRGDTVEGRSWNRCMHTKNLVVFVVRSHCTKEKKNQFNLRSKSRIVAPGVWSQFVFSWRTLNVFRSRQENFIYTVWSSGSSGVM